MKLFFYFFPYFTYTPGNGLLTFFRSPHPPKGMLNNCREFHLTQISFNSGYAYSRMFGDVRRFGDFLQKYVLFVAVTKVNFKSRNDI